MTIQRIKSIWNIAVVVMETYLKEEFIYVMSVTLVPIKIKVANSSCKKDG
jgi:hypothetical protein